MIQHRTVLVKISFALHSFVNVLYSAKHYVTLSLLVCTMTHSSGRLESYLQTVADGLQRWGLRLPALILLEAGRPLAFPAGQLVWVAQPALSLFISGQTIERLAHFLEEPANLDSLITYLENR